MAVRWSIAENLPNNGHSSPTSSAKTASSRDKVVAFFGGRVRFLLPKQVYPLVPFEDSEELTIDIRSSRYPVNS